MNRDILTGFQIARPNFAVAVRLISVVPEACVRFHDIYESITRNCLIYPEVVSWEL
ncbi:hypothetical protein D3C80_1684740 [compost metagenome]